MKQRAVSQLLCRLGGVALAAGCLAVAGPAAAQEPAAPAAPAAPAPQEQAAPAQGPAEAAPAKPPAPPRNYPPPPPRHPSGSPPPATWQQPPGWRSGGQQSNAWGYYPVRHRDPLHRPFSFSIGVGPGIIVGPEDERSLALSYSLFRLGFGVAPRLQFVFSFEGSGASTTSVETGEDSWLRQETWLAGLQYHIMPRVYVRGTVGLGSMSETTATRSFSSNTSVAAGGGLGVEVVQGPHAALALDLNGTLTRYSREYWGTAGVNLTVSFY